VCGCSHAIGLDRSGASSFTFYVAAEALFGNGARTRQRLLRYFERKGVDMSYYAEMSEPLAQQHVRNQHGMFGIAIAAGRDPVGYIGLRPPGAQA